MKILETERDERRKNKQRSKFHENNKKFITQGKNCKSSSIL